MQSRYVKSEMLFRKACNLVPGGVQKSRHPNMFVPGAYPIFMDKAQGSHVWDVDGNEYVDWLLSYGAIVLGYCHPSVDEAIREAVDKGSLIDLAQSLQNQLAEKLISLIPCAERVLFLSTGSGATAAAVRIARVYTGRNIVLRYGYHGWLDWAYGGAGVPKGATQDVFAFEYNNLSSLNEKFYRAKGQVACVIMMPYDVELPQQGFLQGVRDLTQENGSLLIFDEVRSGFRTALGGAQEYFGVRPDMATFCKALANGYPISVVVGQQKVMEAAQKTLISGTHFPSTLGMAASLATIQELEKTHAVEHCWKIGRMLVDGLREVARAAPVTAEVIGITPMPYLMFGPKKDYGKVWQSDVQSGADLAPSNPKAWEFGQSFYGEMARRGIFLHPNHHWFTCLSHTEDDVQQTIDTALQVVSTLKKRG